MIVQLRVQALVVLFGFCVLPAAVLAQSTDPAPDPGTVAAVVPESVSGVSLRVPAGLDSKAPPGVDLTSGLADSIPSTSNVEASEAGAGEWVFVPIPFKNALLGVGLQVGLGRLYRQVDKPAQTQASMFGVGGMYAEGGNWAAVAADRRFWGQGAVRSTIAAGVGEIGYPIELSAIYQGARLPVIQTFSGGTLELGYEARKYLWLSAGFKVATTDITIKNLQLSNSNFSLTPKQTIDIRLATLSADWDSRSDQFYPTGGNLISAEAGVSDTALGSSNSYQVYELSYNGYQTLSEHHTLAWRIAGKTTAGDTPFFALPWYGSGVDLRGYTPGTYIGKSLMAAQAEWRWQVTHRIGLVAFGGVGGVWGSVPFFRQDDFLPAGGVGFRWRLTDKFRVNFRVDYAWGKDDEVLLISAGEAF